MSALLGIFERDGKPVNRELVDRMSASLASLGPDGATRADAPGVALRHHLRNRAPAARERCRAFTDGPGGVLLSGDLRLDNRPELARRLELPNEAARAWSDSALVAAAYDRWEEECPRHLLGDFAFALWDPRRRRLLLARDPLGIRPLFYTAVGASFRFASALRALLRSPDVATDLDDAMIARYLVCPCDSGGPTLYRAIRSLEPSHSLTVGTEGEARPVRYWRPDPAARVFFRDERDYAARYREILDEAVRTRIDAAATPGVMVSGGLDSSAIAATAVAVRRTDSLVGLGHVVTPHSPAAALDERRYLDALSRHLPELDLRLVTAEGASPLDSVDEVFACLRLPVQSGLQYVQKALFSAGRAAGCDVVLAGLGGDEVASAACPGYLAGLLRSPSPGRFARELRAEARRSGHSTARLLRRALVAQLPRPAHHGLHYLRHGYLGNYRASLLPSFARRVSLRAALNGRGGWWDLTGYWPPGVRGELLTSLSLLSSEGLDSQNLVTQAAEAGLDLRFPLADLRLLEYCLAVPADRMRRDGLGRRLLRDACAGLVPERIRRRTDKSVFGPDHVLRVQRELPRIRRDLDGWADRVDYTGVVDTDRLAKTLDRVARADPGTTDASWDCLSDLLPAYYLGRFLELRS